MIVGKRRLTERIAEMTDCSKVFAGRLLDVALDEILDAIVRGDEVRLAGIGTFALKRISERRFRHPATNKPIIVPAHLKPMFKFLPQVTRQIRNDTGGAYRPM